MQSRVILLTIAVQSFLLPKQQADQFWNKQRQSFVGSLTRLKVRDRYFFVINKVCRETQFFFTGE
jgi:hypothetical protein